MQAVCVPSYTELSVIKPPIAQGCRQQVHKTIKLVWEVKIVRWKFDFLRHGDGVN